MSADHPIPHPPRTVRVRKGAQNAAQAMADRLARSLPRWAARLARKAARKKNLPKKSAPVADHAVPQFHYHAD